MKTGAELRKARRAANLTLDSIAQSGGVSPGHLSRIETGKRPVTPATVVLYERALADARKECPSPTVEDVKRTEFLAAAGATVVAAIAPRPSPGPVDLDACAQWLAWETWSHDGREVHEEDVPPSYRAAVVGLLQRRQVVRTPGGFLRFPHAGLIDFHLACRVFDGVAAGSSTQLEAVQTTHATDLVIREFVEQEMASVGTLRRWMTDGRSDVLRVNAAGILAKVAAPAIVDDVIAALRADRPMRHLYLTAVASRVLSLPWQAAQHVAAGGTHATSQDAPRLLVDELRNPRDAAARWCGVVLLHHLGASDLVPVKSAVADALRSELSHENLRTMAALLAGADPVTTTVERTS